MKTKSVIFPSWEGRGVGLILIIVILSISSFAQVKVTDLPAITTIDSADVIPIVDASADTTKKMTMYKLAQEILTGGVAYNLIHGFAYKDSTSYTPNTPARYQYVRLFPGTVAQDQDGVTIAGDSITIATAGDYFVMLSAAVEGGLNEDYHLKMYKNSATFAQSGCYVTTTGASNYQNISWFWYAELAAGDDLSFWIANNTNANDPTFRSFKFYLEIKPE